MSRTNGRFNDRSISEKTHPLDGVIAETPASGAILQMQTGLFEMGRKRALLSGTTKPLAEDLSTIEDHAQAMSRDTYRDRFDPLQNVHDRMQQAEYDNYLEQRNEAQQGETHARANLRDAEATVARAPKTGEKPVANRWTVAAFIVAITITVAPTLHDFIFHTLADNLLAWFASSISAGFVAVMLTFAILGGGRTTWTWAGGAAGIMLGIGLGAVRLSSAEGIGEAMFAIGLTIVEVAAVLLLEWLASGLRASEDQWWVVKAAENEALATRDAAHADLTRWQAKIQELNELIAREIAYVEDRFNRNLHLPELEAVAVKAALDGYNAGITENVGRLRGVRRVL